MAQLAPSSPSVCVERGKEGSGTLIPKGRRKKKWSWLVLATVIVEASGDREKRFTICARPIYSESIHSCTTTVAPIYYFRIFLRNFASAVRCIFTVFG